VNKVHFTPVVLVDRAEVSNAAKTKSIVSQVLIGLILIFELAVVFILPSNLNKSSTFKKELLLEQTATELDELRTELSVNALNQSSLSAIRQAITKQIRDELSLIGNNIRNNPANMSVSELEDIQKALSVCRKLIPRLKYGNFIDQVPNLNRQLILNRLFQED